VDKPLVTVIETDNYVARSEKLMTTSQRSALIEYLAANPTAGDLIQGGGGVRKLRWAAIGRGKSGGVRVIHYFADDRSPVFALDVFAKNEKENYTDAELAMLREIAKRLIGTYARRPK
jgi:hypothetical protein